MIKLESLRIPLDVITNGANLILVSVRDVFEYKDGKKSNNKIGISYEIVEDSNYEKMSIKVIGETKPIVTNEEISNNKDKILVNFVNCIAKPYRTANGSYALSISATEVTLVN